MTAANLSGSYRFGRFELQPDERRLLVAGTPVRLGRHAFDLLTVLVERSGHLVTKDHLLERVWPRLVVEENTLQAQVSALRKTLGADAIATISGQGYRFTLEVTKVDATATSPSAPPKHNLPQQLTSFIGRENEIAEIKHLLGTTRLLTLTGAGGCGKTRLAMQVAAGLVEAFPDGIWLAEFAALADPDLVPQTVGCVLGIKEQPGKSLTQTMIEYLVARQLLLVLDNAEHVLGTCAQLADAVLRGCARLVIVITSRERLGIAGELTYPVPSLSVPDPKRDATPEQVLPYESARLFVERARLQRPHFTVTAENAPALASICHRLDGIPLAIELAAPRVRSMSVEEVSRRLDQRFGLLTGGSRTALPRHRTLRSLIDWSYDLLSDAEKAALRRVSVFAGGWTLEAAEHVCRVDGVDATEVLDLLASLVDKNLVVAEEHGGATRYSLLDTVRHYARDQLRETNEEEAAQRAHLAYFVALAAESERLPTSADQDSLRMLEAERDNMRAALSRAGAPGGDVASGLRLAASLSWFWLVRGDFAEGRGRFSTLLAAAADDLDPTTRAMALRGAGRLAWVQGEYAAAKMLCLEGLEICRELGNHALTAQLLSLLGGMADQQADFDAALAFCHEALAIRRALDDQDGIFNSLILLSYVVLNRGDHESSRTLAEQSLSMADGLGVPQTAEALTALGNAAYVQGDYPSARKWLEEGLAIQRELGLRRRIAALLLTLGQLSGDEGDYPTARSRLVEALRIEQEVGGGGSLTAEILERLGGVALALAGPGPTALILGGAQRLREETGAIRQRVDRDWYDRQVASARALLGDNEAFDRAWQQGSAMTLDQLVRYALDFEPSSSPAWK